MDVFYFILYLIAGICFLIAVVSGYRAISPQVGRTNFIALGLLSWVLVSIIAAGRAL